MNEPPDHTAELRAANLLSFGRDDRPEVLLDEVGVLTDGRVHVTEQHAELLEVLAVAVVDDLGLVLGGDAGQVLALGLGDAQLLVGLLDGLGHHVPVLGLAFGRLHVVVDVVEVDVVERAAAAPGRDGLAQEPLVGLEAELEHPVGLVLDLRHLADDVLGQPLLGLEHVLVLGVVPTELVCAEIDVDGCHQALTSQWDSSRDSSLGFFAGAARLVERAAREICTTHIV
jgi:hypothetical protein